MSENVTHGVCGNLQSTFDTFQLLLHIATAASITYQCYKL